MKQIPIEGVVRQKLQDAVGPEVDVSKHAVFEATALNTRPVRKRHPLYNGAIHSPQYLEQMANAVKGESLPLLIMHDDSALPIGRVFTGEVVNGTELRVLFWVDPANADKLALLNNGTIDQVSVSSLASSVVCSECSFDFIGPDASMDQIWSGCCPDGHTMGQDGAYAKLSGLDTWFEMSLVGMGGIGGAKIRSPRQSYFSEQRLAASGGAEKAMAILTLSSNDLSSEPPKMDFTAFTEKLTSLMTELVETKMHLVARDAEVASLKASNVDLTAKAALAAEYPAALSALTETAKHLLALGGDATTLVPTALPDLVALVNTKRASLRLSVAPVGLQAADSASMTTNTPVVRTSAFKTRR